MWLAKWVEVRGVYMTFWGSQILMIATLVSGLSAYAVKMDETTHDQVIGRLELGIESLDKDDNALTGVQIRLADLYADRARLKAMNEMATGCPTSGCVAARADRERAIGLYKQALPNVEKPAQGRTVLQIAHLHTLNDEFSKAVKLYQSIVNAPKNYSSEVRALANSSLGEIEFRKAEFKKALKFYEAARRENLKNRALVEYRIAWCLLNLGQTDKATKNLIKLLTDPETLATVSTEGKAVDPTFVQDVTGDLAKFLARGDVGPKQITLLKDLSPENRRKANLHMLGTETDRVGKKTSSLVVWAAYVDEPDVQPNEKLEVQIRVAKIFYDMNKLDLAANAYEKAAGLWRQHGCLKNEELCQELKSRMRSMVTAWNKAQKREPTKGLFRVYNAYVNVFTDDVEMLHWAAVVGRELKQHHEAAVLFHRAAVQAQSELAKKPGDKQLHNMLEGSLLGEIEMAEASKNAKAKEQAYNFYLQINPQGEKAVEVRYQRAQLYAQLNRHQEAFSEFHYLASMPVKEHQDIRTKSADLALDSLVALKDDKSLQVRSLEYARLLPHRKNEYLKISRKATLNIVAANLKNTNDRSAYKANLVALNGVNLDGADETEKIKFYKNKIVVAQKALDLGSVGASADKLLKFKSLNAEDREWTFAQKVWVSEVQLNFAEAYKLSKKMKLAHLSTADRHLRLALLADLAGLSTRKHHEDFLNAKPGLRAGNLVRITLIKNSSRPWRELERHQDYLRRTPDLLAGIAVEVFARDKNLAKAERLLKTTSIGRFPGGQTIARHLEMRDFHVFDRKISKHRIVSYNDAVMAKSLKERLKLIGQSDRAAQQAFKRRDWTMQILTLSQLARENRRLYQDISALPVPRRLNPEQRAQYVALMKQKSEPYLARAEKLDAELADMWSGSNSVQNLQTAYMTATPELQKLYRDEIGPLARNAPSGAKNRLLNLLNTPYRRPSQKDIMVARQELQANPFDISKAQNLRALEAQNGRPAMVAYLDERILQLKKGKDL